MRYESECKMLAMLVLSDCQEGDTYYTGRTIREHTFNLAADLHDAITSYMDWLRTQVEASPAARQAIDEARAKETDPS